MRLNETLGALRERLSIRLGYGAQGAQTGSLVSTLNEFLRSSQEYLWWNFGYRSLRTHVTKTIGASQTYVDFPVEIDQDRVEWISFYSSGIWSPALKRGIEPEMYTFQSTPTRPTNWDMNLSSGSLQIEFWPETDQIYTYRVMGIAPLSPFTSDSHRSSIASDLVYLHALGMAKHHYGHDDAQLYISMFADLEASVKNVSRPSRVYRQGRQNEDFNPIPKLLGRDA
jgi:hypothetical protein